MKYLFIITLLISLLLNVEAAKKCIVKVKKTTEGISASNVPSMTTKTIPMTTAKTAPVIIPAITTKVPPMTSIPSIPSTKTIPIIISKTVPNIITETTTKTPPMASKTSSVIAPETKLTKTKKTTKTIKKTTTTVKKTTSIAAKPTSNASSSSARSLPNIVGGTTGKTTRYWDCCVPTCSWKENTKGPVVNVCKIDGHSIVPNFDYRTGSACSGGSGYMCNDNQPWALNENIAFGFVASSFTSGNQAEWCCSCYRLQFTSGNAKGKQMIVQVTNTGTDLSTNHFDIQIPGGGVGIFNGCQSQWGTGNDGWGQRYGGISSRSSCADLPKELQDGCYWRYDWFMDSDNPSVVFEPVQCPIELTSKSGCTPTNNNSFKAIPWN